jgi:CRISPR-associated protein Csx14
MPDYRISLDPRNPGQYLACCGLFELADLAVPGAEAAFEGDSSSFVLKTSAALPPYPLSLAPGQSFDDKPYDATLEPLDLIFSGGALTLNWWLNETLTDKSGLKTWGGQQTPRRVFSELLRLLDNSTQFGALFNTAVFTKSRFGVDARSAWEAIDAGYSPNDTGQAATTFPWVEILAVIGLQGFRPARQPGARYRYSAWLESLPITVARAACGAPWSGLPGRLFEFRVAGRGQGYKTFLFGEGVDHV